MVGALNKLPVAASGLIFLWVLDKQQIKALLI